MLVDDEVGFPHPQEPQERLHRSGWRLRVTFFKASSGPDVWAIVGHQGENLIEVEAPSRCEAWRKAALAAASCGMLRGWPRPSDGRW